MILLSIRVGGVDLSVASVSISISDILCSIFLCCPNSWCDVANIQTKPTCLCGYCREDSQMNRAIRNYIYIYMIYIYILYIFLGGSSPSQIVGKTGKRLSLQPYRNNQHSGSTWRPWTSQFFHCLYSKPSKVSWHETQFAGHYACLCCIFGGSVPNLQLQFQFLSNFGIDFEISMYIY